MTQRNATAVIVGAGDYIGAEIAKKFAAEGFTVFLGRRQGEKLEPLIKAIEAAGGKAFGRTFDARNEDEVVELMADADAHAPVCTEKLNPRVVMVKPGQDGVRTYGTGSLNRPRIRRIFV